MYFDLADWAFELVILCARRCQVVETFKAEDMQAGQLFGIGVYVITLWTGYFFSLWKAEVWCWGIHLVN